MRLPIFSTPRIAGVGFKPEHFDAIVRDPNAVGFFEVHAENYMGRGGAPHATLERIRQDYPVFVHGVGLSIGSVGPLDKDHLARLKSMVARYEPQFVSEHLAWSTHDNSYYNDLLPVPYNTDTLVRVASHIDEVQDALGRSILLENPSTYVMLESSTMRETDFIGEIVRRTGCGLLLDINNVFISATNHRYAPETYLAEFPLDKVGEIHLAGHATEEDDEGCPLLIDAHDRPVASQVWALFEKAIASRGLLPTLIEWDNDLPAWSVLKSEAEKANMILSRFASPAHPELLRRAS
ncbi:DUF692 domain-containing protein [Aestuariivirga sp.]|uniref:MNIO family bufferin maturase n=1 Tax=Aestuariivirga sp. TaxID=2650926 RepID=UPI003593032D